MAPAARLGLLAMLLKVFGAAVWLLLPKGLRALGRWLPPAWLQTTCCLLTGAERFVITPRQFVMSDKGILLCEFTTKCW
jgi:hypothetical protein